MGNADSKNPALAGSRLLEAAQGGRLSDVQKALKAGADIDTTNEDGDTALMKAAFWGHADIVEYLLTEGCNVNAVDDDGRTALMRAAENCHAAIVQCLVTHGGDTEIVNKSGRTAMDSAPMKEIRAILRESRSPTGRDTSSRAAFSVCYSITEARPGDLVPLAPSAAVNTADNEDHTAAAKANVTAEIVTSKENPEAPHHLCTELRTDRVDSGKNVEADGELLLAESVQRIVREWSTMVTVVNSHSTELRRMRVLLTEILQHSKDIPSLFVLLPANKTVVSKLKNPFKAIFNHEMRLFPVCPVTLKAVPCAIDEKGWEISKPREFVKQFGPALLCGLRVLQFGLLLGRVVGIPFPNFTVPEDISGAYSHTAVLMESFDRISSQKAIRESWDVMCEIGSEFALDWAQEGAVATNEESFDSIKGVLELSGQAYSDMLTFLLKFGDINSQLKGMKRLQRPDGSTEWVSIEGEAEWRRMHCETNVSAGPLLSNEQGRSTSVEVEDISITLPPTNLSLHKEASLISWIDQRLVTDKHVHTSKATTCKQLLWDNDITTTEVLGSLDPQAMAKVIESADPQLTVGMKTHMMCLYEEARALFSHHSTPTAAGCGAVASASDVAELREKLEAQGRELCIVKKKTDGLKPGKPPAGGGGGLVQVNASEDAHDTLVSGAVIEEILRHPTMIDIQTCVHHLASQQPDQEQQTMNDHVQAKCALFGKSST